MKNKLDTLKELIFPAIAVDIITGVNIYPKSIVPSPAKFRVTYLHSNLGSEDEHRKQLEEKVQEYGISVVLSPQHCQCVNRTTVYRLERGWQADEYYDTKGNKVTKRQLRSFVEQSMPIIGISKQYELRIDVDNRQTLDVLLEILRKHVNTYIVNKKTGKLVTYPTRTGKKRKENRMHKIIDAWEVPCISVDSDEPPPLLGYQPVKRISLKGFGTDVTSLVGRKWNERIIEPITGLRYPTFREYLEYTGISNVATDTSINKILADWINKLDWKRLHEATFK